MRRHEDPGTQEKREDVCPLQEGEGVIDGQNIPMGTLGCLAWLLLCLHGFLYLVRLCFFLLLGLHN